MGPGCTCFPHPLSAHTSTHTPRATAPPQEKNRVTAERLAALKRQGKRRGGRRTKTYEEPERDWRVIGYARRPPQPPLPDMPQRPPPPPVVPYSAQRLLVPGPPDKPRARSSAAAAAAEKIARDLRQTVFVPGLADALLIASSAAGDDGVEILQRAAKYGMYVAVAQQPHSLRSVLHDVGVWV